MTKLIHNIDHVNRSGFKPISIDKECRVFVKVQFVGEHQTKGGIIVENTISKMQCWQHVHGMVTEIYCKNKDIIKEVSSKIKIGDVISFPAYAGVHEEGDDGWGYRLLDGDKIQSLYVGENCEYKDLDETYLSHFESIKNKK